MEGKRLFFSEVETKHLTRMYIHYMNDSINTQISNAFLAHPQLSSMQEI